MFSVIIRSLAVIKIKDGVQVYSCSVTDIEFRLLFI